MRVAFNAHYLSEPRTGTGRYVANLLSALGRVDGINEYVIFTPERPPEAIVNSAPSTFTWKPALRLLSGHLDRVARLGDKIDKVVWEEFAFAHAARELGAKVMHTPHFAPPISRPRNRHRIPRVVTIHDLANLVLPEYSAKVLAKGYSEVVARVAQQAAAIITPSQFTKREVIARLNIPEERVHVIQEAPDPIFRRVTDPERIAAVRTRYGLGERYILNVGGMDARKNIQALVGAFHSLIHSENIDDVQLFIVGDPTRLGKGVFPDWRPYAELHGISDRIVCQPVAEQDLPAIYSGATCFVFTSLYEGFGLTPLEAMACGAPVICSGATALEEVVGSAGKLVDACDVNAVGDAMWRMLNNAEMRADYAARGPVHAHQFSWDRAAVETSAIYAEVTGTRQG